MLSGTCFKPFFYRWVPRGAHRSSLVWLAWQLCVGVGERVCCHHVAHLASPTYSEALLPVRIRCMGAKLGRRPYLENAILTEPDLLTLGDYATIESGGTLQAHLFQDRVRTVQRITIGEPLVPCVQCVACGGHMCVPPTPARTVVMTTHGVLSFAGDSCSVGANSIVLLGSTLEDNAHVLPLSLILRNEGVPAGEWHGSPSVSHELYRSSV